MTKGLKRYYGRGDLHFLTFSCHRRMALLGSAASRNLFIDVLGKMRVRHGFRLVGYVVMPEHVHLLVTEPPGTTPSKILQALKQRVSSDLRGNGSKERAQPGLSASIADLPHFWQHRFHDFNVRSSAKIREKLDYMHMNPVKRGLVTDPAEWTWSSYSYYANGEPGLVAIDPVF